MRGCRPAIVGFVLIGLSGLLAGCGSIGDFDLDKLDVFGLSEKKKLPGERRPLFPEGVPGVTQGVPPELIKGRQPQPGAETAAVEPAKPPEPEKPKAEAKPKPPKPTVRNKPTRLTVSPEQKQQQPQPQQEPQTQQTGTDAPWVPPAQQPSAWPSAPPPGTFQR